VSQKVSHFYFHENFGNSISIFIFFNVKFRTDLWRKLELKLPPSLKSVAALYLAKGKWSTVHLYIHISENNMLNVRWHLLHEFVYLFILPETDVIDIIAIFCLLHYSFLSLDLCPWPWS